ncbi:uncharacterized protein ATC70_000041 [Mucor velutinosus]|uniref:Uncharacterized protein n=1 Tax=Mucor velutinosus TaxID=708070 RepID=A0AAN7D526_9FUNG|nr:hypothetical protein ATC70_000041 [Mucor velutinosus]
MSRNRITKQRKKDESGSAGSLKKEPRTYTMEFQQQKRRKQKQLVKNYLANMNASGVNVNEARRAVPARHPRPLSSAERNQQEPSSSSANNRPNGGSNVINLDELTGDVDEEVNTSLSDRYLKWQDLSEVLLKSYIESHELHGHADPCLDAPIIIGTKPQSCDCTSRITSWSINGFMMFSKYKNQRKNFQM